MAAAFAQAIIEERGLPWHADSAGLYVSAGMGMSPLTAQVLTRRQIPLKPHRAQILTHELVASAQLILCMTRQQAVEVEHRFPDAASKIRVLRSCGQEHRTDADCDIVDPFGGSDDDYEQAAQQIETAIRALFDELEGHSP